MTEPPRRAAPWSLVPCAVLLVMYLLSAARHVLGGDNAEFVTVATDGGVAHPPGYPLFVLWLRAFGWLPSESHAHAAALATALTGGLALVLLSRAARTVGLSLAALGLGLSPYLSALDHEALFGKSLLEQTHLVPLLRVLPRGTEPPSVPEVEEMKVGVFARLHGSSPAPRDSWAQGARSDYARTWLMLADAYERGGAPEDAARNRARAEAFAASSKP